MKKTLLITLEYPPVIGGIATYPHALARALPAQDQELIVLAPPSPGAETWDAEQPFQIIRAPFLFRFFWPRWLLLCWHVWKICKTHKIERVMLHHVLPVGYAAWLLKKLKGTPYLVFSHGTDLVASTAHAWKKRMVTAIATEAEQLIFNSESLQARFLKAFPALQERCTVMYPCPDKAFSIPPSQQELDALRAQYALEGKQVLLSVSRIAEGKGFPHLARMLPAILKEVPHLVWVVVGDGPKQEALIKEVQRYGLQNVVRFVGAVPHQELKQWYHLADVFALLTHPNEGDEEGLGLVFLEAAACGIPAIAGRSGGVEEAVLHTQTGIVVDLYHGDKKIIESLIELFAHTEFADKLGKQAQERVQRTFVWEHQLKKLTPWL